MHESYYFYHCKQAAPDIEAKFVYLNMMVWFEIQKNMFLCIMPFIVNHFYDFHLIIQIAVVVSFYLLDLEKLPLS